LLSCCAARRLESANAGADAALERSGVTTREMRERRVAAVRSRLPRGAPRLHLPAPERRAPVAQAPPPPEALRPARPRPTPPPATPQRAPATTAPPTLALRPLVVSRAATPPPPRPARRDRGPFGVTLSFAVAVEPTPLGPELRVRATSLAVRAGPLAASAEGPPEQWSRGAGERNDVALQARNTQRSSAWVGLRSLTTLASSSSFTSGAWVARAAACAVAPALRRGIPRARPWRACPERRPRPERQGRSQGRSSLSCQGQPRVLAPRRAGVARAQLAALAHARQRRCSPSVAVASAALVRIKLLCLDDVSADAE
jgi:hypothetical protein